MKHRQGLFKRWASCVTMMAFFVFTVIPPANVFALSCTELGNPEDGGFSCTDSNNGVSVTTLRPVNLNLANFNSAAGSKNVFNLKNGDFTANVEQALIGGSFEINDGILSIYSRSGLHILDTADFKFQNGSLLAAAGNMNKLTGKIDATGFVLNEGHFHGTGDVAFVGKAVENKGTIDLPLNHVLIGAGKAVTVGLSGDNLVSVVVAEGDQLGEGEEVFDFKGNKVKNQIENSGNMTANKITLNAKGVDSVFEKAINLKGEIKAVDVDTNERGELVLISMDDVYSKAILDASKIYIRSGKGDIDMMGVTRAKHLDEKGASFQIGGTFEVENSYHQNLDHAITYAANTSLSGTINDAENIIINSGVILTLTGNTAFRADYDVAAPGLESNGSGAFLMDSTASIIGNNYDLSVTASQNSTLGIISGVDELTLGRNGAYTPIFSSSTSVDDIDVNTFKTNNGVTFTKTVGTGADANNARLIYDVTQLQGMNNNRSYYYKLANNIDATATSSWNAGAGFNMVGDFNSPFTGSLNGQNHTIDGLYINRPATSYVGMFGYKVGGSIQNVSLTNVNVTGLYQVAGLVGYNTDSSLISNTSVTGQVHGAQGVGGLVGFNRAGSTVSNSHSTAAITGGNNAHTIGGLIGYNYASSVSNSYATGNVTAGNSSNYVGGLFGLNVELGNSTSVTQSFATGNVVAGASSGAVGGFAGAIGGISVSNSYTTGSVTVGSGSYWVGGFAGLGYYGATISQSYSSAAISASGSTYVGGFLGRTADPQNFAVGAMNSNYWNAEVSGLASNQDFGDQGNNVGDVTSLTTEQVKDSSSFSGWDTSSVWAMTGNSTPDLRWEYNVWNGSGNWSDPANWSKGVVPGADSKIMFNGTSVGNSVIDSGFAGNVNKIFIDHGYTGTITTQSDVNVSGDFMQKDGTFNQNGHNMDVGGDSAVDGGTYVVALPSSPALPADSHVAAINVTNRVMRNSSDKVSANAGNVIKGALSKTDLLKLSEKDFFQILETDSNDRLKEIESNLKVVSPSKKVSPSAVSSSKPKPIKDNSISKDKAMDMLKKIEAEEKELSKSVPLPVSARPTEYPIERKLVSQEIPYKLTQPQEQFIKSLDGLSDSGRAAAEFLNVGEHYFEAEIKDVFKNELEQVERFKRNVFDSPSESLGKRAGGESLKSKMMLTKSTGTVKVISEDGHVYNAEENRPLKKGDQIWTDAGASVEIKTEEGSIIEIKENSLIRLKNETQELGVQASNVDLVTFAFGGMTVNVVDKEAQSGFKVQAPANIANQLI